MKKIGVIAGSLREQSYSLKVAKTIIKMLPRESGASIIDFSACPLYNEDLDEAGREDANFTAFRENVKKYDAFLFVTPEYNRSMPAGLKNAIDVGSRPYGQSAWENKPAGIISVSMGGMGGFGANHHLRQTLVFLNMPAMAQPEAYLGNVASMFDENGNLTSVKTAAFLQSVADKFVEWIEKF
jgi:chromate reductase